MNVFSVQLMDALDALMDQVERTARLIRSKGVGVYFVTQTPKDVPSDVLAQLPMDVAPAPEPGPGRTSFRRRRRRRCGAHRHGRGLQAHWRAPLRGAVIPRAECGEPWPTEMQVWDGATYP